ncbi:MAG TPA: hypothetical protein VH968_12630 [Gaiellaceae bacterium]
MTDLRRDVVALTCAVSAGIHAGLTPEHFEERLAAGAGFAVSAVLLAGIAVGLARRPRWWQVDAAIAVLGGLLVGYALAITTGVPGLVPEPEPVDALALVTKAIEGVGLVVALSLKGHLIPRFRPLPVGLVALVVAFSALAAVAVSDGHAHDARHHHSHG